MVFDLSRLLTWLQQQIEVVQLMLARPAVQRQLFALLAILLVAWLLPRLIDLILRRVEPQVFAASTGPVTWRMRIVRWLRAVDYALFPILALIGYRVAIDQFALQGWPAGLIESVLPVFWLFLGYRLLASLVLATFPKVDADRYLRRFLRPILLIVALFLVNRLLFEVFAINDMVLVQIQGAIVTLGNLLTALNTFLIFYVAGWAVYELLVHLFRRSQAEPGVGDTVSNVSRWAIVGLGGLAALGVLGVDLATLAWIGTGLSVGIGFGLQELFGNFVSGILLAFERSVRPGDIIETGGQRGTVRQIGIRSTLLRTADNVEVFVPNKELLIKPVLAYTYSDRTSKVRLTVGVDYASDLEQVRQLLLETVRRHPLILPEPAPGVVLAELGPYSVNYQVYGSIDDYSDGLAVKSEVTRMVRDVLVDNGIHIPYPRQDVHLTQ